MTMSGWLAIGVVIAAFVGPSVAAWPMTLGCAAAVLAAAAFRMHGLRGRRLARRPLLVAAGMLALALRLALGSPSPTAPPEIPDGRGPWTGTVVTRSPNREGQQVAVVLIDHPPPAGWLVASALPRYPEIEPGVVVTVAGSIDEPPDGPYGEYLRRIGVVGTLRSRELAIVGAAAGPGPMLERLRRGAGDALAAAIPEPEAGLAAGIVIGLRDRVNRDLAADFTTVGASHVVAISGWNIAIVAATVAAVAGRLGRRRRSLVLVVAIVAYVVFAGASPSVVRAAAMAGVVLLARETGRAGRASAALGWAAALLLLVDPALFRDAGFQLSTLATAGILAWADPIDRRLRSALGGRVPGWLAESLAVSLAAQAATLPIVLLAFGRLALIAPVINLAIVPFVAPAMAVAMVALAGGVLTLVGAPAFLGTIAGLPAWAVLTLICTIVRAGASLPFASVTLEPPWTFVTAGACVVTPAAIVVLRRQGRRARPREPAASVVTLPIQTDRAGVRSAAAPGQPARAEPRARGSMRLVALPLGVAVAMVGLAVAHRSDGSARITILDVGQGDAILVEGGQGGRMLVDGGPDPDRLLVELDRRLPPWDRRIDILVLTHPHEDHVAGMALLLERYRVGKVFETGMRGLGPGYKAFAGRLRSSPSPPVATLATGGRIALDGIRLDVIWPDPGTVPVDPPDGGRAINDASIVFLGEVAGRRFLLTGDVEDDVDPILAARGLPPIDILKVAHHGSGSASTAGFLATVQSRIAVVSAGSDNPYGHPARSTVDRLGASGARVLRTDTDGSVTVTIDPKGEIRVATSGARATRPLPVVGPRLASTSDSLASTSRSTAPVPTPRPPETPVFRCGIPSTG